MRSEETSHVIAVAPEGAAIISSADGSWCRRGAGGLSTGSSRGWLLGDTSVTVTRVGGRTCSLSRLQAELINNNFTADGDRATTAPGCPAAWPNPCPQPGSRASPLPAMAGVLLVPLSPALGVPWVWDGQGRWPWRGASAALQEGAEPALSCREGTPRRHHLPAPGPAPSSPSPSASLAGV